MIQRREHFGFALKPGEALRVGGKCRRQDFDRDVALQFGICRAVDLAHAAGADGRDDFVRTEPIPGGRGNVVREL